MWEGGEGGVRVPTSDPHTINACWFLFLLFVYLLVAEAASFDKKSHAGAIQLVNGTTAGPGYWEVGLEWPYNTPPGQ